MKREDIIRMAREAGIHVYPEFEEAFERFAALVAAASASVEREACAKVCSEMYLEGDMNTGLAADLIRARSQS